MTYPGLEGQWCRVTKRDLELAGDVLEVDFDGYE